MHVGIISELSDPARGGAERYLHALAARLREHGHAVTWVARAGPQARPVRSFPAARRPLYYARTFLPALRDEGAERVLATVPVPGCDFYQPHNGILAASMPPRLEPLPWAWRLLRRVNPHRNLHFFLLRRLEARALEPPAKLLAVSPRVVKDAMRFVPRAEALLLRPGVDLERFSPGGTKAKEVTLLFVAQNPRLKGLRTAIDALRDLPEARLVVVSRERPVGAERVDWRGSVADLPALYREAHLLVHPTYYDSASRVVLEAMACGTPAVTTVRDGNADLALEGGGAALERPGDATALAKAVKAVLAVADGGRARAVAERFPREKMLDQVVEAVTCVS